MLPHLSGICCLVHRSQYFCLSRRQVSFRSHVHCRYLAVFLGDPRQLIHPTDSQGHFCGSGNLIDRPYVYYFDWTKCVKALNLPANMFKSRPFVCPTTQVCVQQCPNVTSHYQLPNYHLNRICTYDVDPRETNNEKLVQDGRCAAYVIASKALFGRCIPQQIQSLTNNIIQVCPREGDRSRASNDMPSLFFCRCPIVQG